MASDTRIPLLYILHSGNLFGTERMAIATLRGLDGRADGHAGNHFDSLLLTPPGPAAEFARQSGVAATVFDSRLALLRAVRAFLRGKRAVTLVTTGVSQALIATALACLMGVRLRQIHLVHGGTDERLSYGRKKWLMPLGVEFVAVSAFVRERLIAHGVTAARIRVIENFLTSDPDAAPHRATAFASVRRLIVVSRLDPIKCVGLLLDAFEHLGPANPMQARVFGTGWQETELRQRAATAGLAIEFAGYSRAIAEALAESDLLVHTCPEEPFGLVILEAMAAGIPVLVPDRGGPCTFIRDNDNGFVYRANDAASLADALRRIGALPGAAVQSVADAASRSLRERFDPARRIDDYSRLFAGART